MTDVVKRLRDTPAERIEPAPENKPPADLCLSAPDWLVRDLPARDFLLGEVISTTSRALCAADTGLGKTMFGVALAVALATGSDFLHWTVRRPVKVLYVDGEMPRELIKERLIEAAARVDCSGEHLTLLSILSTEDAPRMPPLNTPEGQAWMDGLIAELGPFDVIVFDNIAALTIGDMRDEEGWRAIEPWVLSLSAQRIGQVWFHHTGHDGSRSYGSKVREWKMDTVMLGEKLDEQGADVAMRLTFKKARTRTPDNRADFEAFDLRLMAGEWTAEPAETSERRGPPKGTNVALDTLKEAIGGSGAYIPTNSGAPTNVKGVSLDTWRDYYHRRKPLDVEGDDGAERKKALAARRQLFGRARDYLQEARIIQAANNWYWIV